jgi:predicted outer membrane repeat protein
MSSLKQTARFAGALFRSSALFVGLPALLSAATVTKTVGTFDELATYVAKAEASTSTYQLQLKKTTYNFKRTLVVQKAKLIIIGSSSGADAASYIFSGNTGTNDQFGGQIFVRMFDIRGTASSLRSVQFKGLTMQDGISSTSGGAIYGQYANLNVRNCIFRNNVSDLPGSAIAADFGKVTIAQCYFQSNRSIWFSKFTNRFSLCGGQMSRGGGVALYGFEGELNATISASTFDDNKACRGGGLSVWGRVKLKVENSTFANNIAGLQGGAIHFQAATNSSGLSYSPSVTLSFNTITRNHANWPIDRTVGSPLRFGGGLGFESYGGAMVMAGNIVAENNTHINDDIGTDCGMPNSFFSSLDYNANILGEIGDCIDLGDPFTWGIGRFWNPWPPDLGFLTGNGVKSGFNVPTIMPNRTSSALMGYDSDGFGSLLGNTDLLSCPSVDQRGMARLQKPRFCSIGAIESAGN